jgi:membrane protein involved in colicin uptake
MGRRVSISVSTVLAMLLVAFIIWTLLTEDRSPRYVR